MDEKIKEKTEFFLLLSKNLPKNKSFYGIMLVLKFLPLFIITHDWNISYKKGISYWVRKFTLCEILSSSKMYNFYIIILVFFLIILTILYFIFCFYRIIIKHPFLAKIYVIPLFYIFYAFNQYIYSIIAEIISNKKKRRFEFRFIYYFISYYWIIFNNVNLFKYIYFYNFC